MKNVNENMGVIYLRTNKINGKKYVGQVTTKNFKKRQNRWNSLSEKYAGKVIDAARAKYGIEAFDFEILKECEDEELNQWEMYYIKELNTKVPNGYNMTDGGDGKTGCSCHHTEETKKKISKANKGHIVTEEARKKISETHKGKHLSEEHKKKLSELFKNKIFSEETKRKISEAKKNVTFSEDHKKKLSESKKGKYNTHKSKQLLQLNKNTNEVIAEFPSCNEVQRQFGFSQSCISECCNGKRKSAYGYIWRYKEESAA